MRHGWIGFALAALVLSSCAPPAPQAGAPSFAAGPGAAGSGTVLVVRKVLVVAGADAAWRARLLREAAAAPDAALGAAPLAEIIVRTDAGGVISVVQPADMDFTSGERVGIGVGTGAAVLSRL